MKNKYATILIVFSFFLATTVWSQSFTIVTLDTVRTGPVSGDIELHVGNKIYNTSNTNPLTIDVVRVQNTTTTGWTSAFCLDICYSPFTDSVQFTVAPGDSVDFIFHFYTSATPDSGTALMKVKDINSSAVGYRTFKAISQLGFSVNELSSNPVQVQLFPNPACSQKQLNIEVSSTEKNKNDLTFYIYNLTGSQVAKFDHLKEGLNQISLQLPVGLYTYTLNEGNEILNSGKLSAAE